MRIGLHGAVIESHQHIIDAYALPSGNILERDTAIATPTHHNNGVTNCRVRHCGEIKNRMLQRYAEDRFGMAILWGRFSESSLMPRTI